MLSSRADKIIRILARFPRSQPVTAAAISEELGLSRRSVLRELPAAEQWLTGHGFYLIRKTGSGLMLDEPPEPRSALLKFLGQEGSNIACENRSQRQKLLRRELLAAGEPINATISPKSSVFPKAPCRPNSIRSPIGCKPTSCV